MSENVLRLIPQDPDFVPSEQASRNAKGLFEHLVQDATEICASTEDCVQFFDGGECFESVRCPACGHDVQEWWPTAMDDAWEGEGFGSLEVLTPCCDTATSLNLLRYEGEQGFARFALEARDPGLAAPLSPAEVQQVEAELGCRMRQIVARY